MQKVYVDVLVLMTKEGHIIPKKILWDDGRIFDINKILQTKNAHSLKTGGEGLRFLCVIENATRFLFYERNKWFITSV